MQSAKPGNSENARHSRERIPQDCVLDAPKNYLPTLRSSLGGVKWKTFTNNMIISRIIQMILIKLKRKFQI